MIRNGIHPRNRHNTAGPYIAHLESQYSWAQIRLAAYILGSRPSAQVPNGLYTAGMLRLIVHSASSGTRTHRMLSWFRSRTNGNEQFVLSSSLTLNMQGEVATFKDGMIHGNASMA